MELSDYISLTLSEIAKGVEKATKSDNNAFVLAKTQMKVEGIPIARLCGTAGGDTYKPIIKVAFRVSVEVDESERTNSKMGGSLKVVSADITSLSKDERRSLQEVSFELPLILSQKK